MICRTWNPGFSHDIITVRSGFLKTKLKQRLTLIIVLLLEETLHWSFQVFVKTCQMNWESGQHFGTPSGFPVKWSLRNERRNSILMMTCHYPDPGGSSDWMKQISNQSVALPRSGCWWVISMEFLNPFFRRHLVGKPTLASQNVSCFLRLQMVDASQRNNLKQINYYCQIVCVCKNLHTHTGKVWK